MLNTSLIITSIASPNDAMKAFAKGCAENTIEFVVIGDAKSPKDFSLKGCRFISFDEQQKEGFQIKLAKLLPKNHYSRKNIGYLLSRDKELIIETDDDNIPYATFWNINNQLEKIPNTHVIEENGWVNVYKYFTDEVIWPRGFPLELVNNSYKTIATKSSTIKQLAPSSIQFPIVQSLADSNPDVDAVYRLSYSLPKYFHKDKAVVLGKGSWCPFNSQNTLWYKDAFPLMYLPSNCSFRMTDIWRSFIAQRIAWECDWMILFKSPTVTQERNEHNLLKDFEDEIPGYLNNDRIRKSLEDINLKSGKENITDNLLNCYKMMIDNKWIAGEEMKLVEAWCEEFAS